MLTSDVEDDTEMTALMPYIESKPQVYMTWRRRGIRKLLQLKRRLMSLMNGTSDAFKEVAARLREARATFRAWKARLRKVHAYDARHRRLRRETFVSQSTPAVKRTYPARPVKTTRTVRAVALKPGGVVRSFAPAIIGGRAERHEHERQFRTTINNARLILTGAEGPLAP